MLFIFVAPVAFADSDTPELVNRPLFTSDSTIALAIEGPLTTISRERSETEELPAILKYTDPAGTAYAFDIQLRARGKFRRGKEICRFPPIRVNFKKSQLDGTVFEGQDKLKLVTDCQTTRKNYQQLLQNEYLAYKLLNVLTDYSFRARLLKVTYVDTDDDNDTRESYAFFIEDKDHIAERLGLQLLEIPRTKYSALNAEQANLVNIYEYFIGNTDFSMIAGPKDTPCCHNIVLYQHDSDPIMPIPYDFDHSGIVDAPYAAPNPKFKISKVTQRLYRGRCTNNALLDSTLEQYRSKRSEFESLVNQMEGFDDRDKKKTLGFIDSFYKFTGDQKSIERNLIKKCS